MTFVPVDELPKKASGRQKCRPSAEFASYHNYKEELERFMSMNVRIVKIVVAPGEYGPKTDFRCPIRDAIKYLDFPIDLKTRNKEVYLVRRDI